MEKLTKEQIENLPEWMPVRDFEGVYEVNCRAGIIRNARTLKVRKPILNYKGYLQVGLSKNGKKYSKNLHRLVANAAYNHYGISTNGLCVCHLDEERYNPCIDNLALGTAKENSNFEKAKQRYSEAKKGKHKSEEHKKKLSESHKGEKAYWFGKHRSADVKKKISEAHPKKAVGAYKNGELILTFQSTAEAGRNGFNYRHISACCRGKRRTHKSLVWKYL